MCLQVRLLIFTRPFSVIYIYIYIYIYIITSGSQCVGCGPNLLNYGSNCSGGLLHQVLIATHSILIGQTSICFLLFRHEQLCILKKCFVLLASSGVARGGATGAPVLS